MERLTLHELAAATGGTLTRPADGRLTFDGVSLDTRTLPPGEVFWAIRGRWRDGHDFVSEAFAAGAPAAVVERPVAGPAGPCVLVENSVAALARLAGWYRSLLDAFVIGVTGSVGKTTTRELIFAALGGGPAAVRSRKNHNNELGVPLTLLDVAKSHRFAVVEMGAARVGDIAALATIARPEAGIVTRFGVAHVETFGGEDEIVRGKGELVEALPQEGFCVLPGDQPAARLVVPRATGEVMFVGQEEWNDHKVRVTAAAAEQLTFSVDGSTFQIAATGAHLAVPAGMAVAVARKLGRTDRQIAAGLREFQPVEGRGRVAVRSPWTVIDDAYNANPDSMRAALDALAAWPGRCRRVLVCGDMYGLGERAAAAHVELGRQAALQGIDLVAAVGDYARQVAHGACRSGMDARRLACFADRDGAAAWLRETLSPGDVVWVKGSRPMELERLVAALAETAGEAARPLRAAA
jgi:UDP-N-acetylmuramoyl-tripeptide--D-alanyl-D-alanine ligase